MKRTPKVRVGKIASALDRFEDVWNKAARAVRDTRSENSLTVVSYGRGSRIIHRDAKTGSFASRRSAKRIRDTSTRAAESLKRLVKT
jgi:hypothetical protein